jgi:hypothetical protein
VAHSRTLALTQDSPNITGGRRIGDAKSRAIACCRLSAIGVTSLPHLDAPRPRAEHDMELQRDKKPSKESKKPKAPKAPKAPSAPKARKSPKD